MPSGASVRWRCRCTSMSTAQIPLGFSDLVVPMGSHIAYTYESEDERRDRLFAFLVAGLSNEEKCVAAVPEYRSGFWRDGLASRGIDVGSLPEGQFRALAAEEVNAWGAPDSPAGVRQMIGSLLDESRKGGWRGTRMCASFPHLLQHPDVVPFFLKTEAHVNELVADQPIIMFCTFAAARLHRKLLDACLSCHPLVTDGRSLTPSDSYLPTERLMERLPEILQHLRAGGALPTPFALLDFCVDIPVIHTGGEMDIYTAPRFEELADWAISVGCQELIVDLSSTTFMDAASISALVRVAMALEGKGGQLAIFDPVDPPRKVFRLVRLDERIRVCRRLDEAVESARS